MEDPKERLTKSISDGEMENRWKSVRQMMRFYKIDVLVMQTSEEFFAGALRWLTDHSARHQFPMTVIFPVDDDMTTITCGPDAPADQFPPEWSVRGVKSRLGACYVPTIQYTETLHAEIACRVLGERKKATIGLVELSLIAIPFYKYLVDHLHNVEFVDATERVHEIMVIKSAEEIDLIKATAALQDRAIEHLRKTIKPGMRDFDVLAEAQYSTVRDGSERQLIKVGSAPDGTPACTHVRHFQNRMIKEGDQVSVLIETNGPGGYYTETMKIFMIGRKPSQELQDAYGVSTEIQRMNVDQLRPGADPRDLWDMTINFLRRKGYHTNYRLYAHGQGTNLVERPLIRYNETWKVKAGMNISVHPAAVTKTTWASVCENWLIGKDGAGPCLHSTQQGIIIIG